MGASVRPDAEAGVKTMLAVPEFRSGGDFTVGVEEELMLVDESGALLGAAASPLLDPVRVMTRTEGGVTGEIWADQVELSSPVCANAQDVVSSLRMLRRRVADRGLRAMAVGVHPTAPFGAAAIVSSPRYDAILQEYGGLLRTPTAALQVHVGMPDQATAMAAYRALRGHVPLLRALAANSPYWHGVDSGLASARSAILRSYPRTTLPPLLRTWEEYVSRTESLLAAAAAPDPTYVWWDVRPRPEFGTLEVRVMDAQPSLARVAGLTALVQGIARGSVEAPVPGDLSDDFLAANDHRAMRQGLDACITDLDGAMRPLREIGCRVVAQARTALAGGAHDSPLDVVVKMLEETGEPARQRDVVATDGLPALIEDLVARTSHLDVEG